VEEYMNRLAGELKLQFGRRLLYVGLQGSHIRGEATENSDIDAVVILEDLTVRDLAVYKNVIEKLPWPEKACGFLCGRQEMAKWNPLEICGLLGGTKDYYGELRTIVPVFDSDDVRNFAKMSLNNLYHEICHRYIHGGIERSIECLPGTYKGVFFILQNLHYLKTGEFISGKAYLLEKLEGSDRKVMELALNMNDGCGYDFDECFGLLFTWCQEKLCSL